jgi:hypothetical protein
VLYSIGENMTKVTYWYCNICGKDFKEGEVGYSDNAPLEIVIPSSYVDARGGEKFHFTDTCLDCREKLSNFVHSMIK